MAEASRMATAGTTAGTRRVASARRSWLRRAPWLPLAIILTFVTVAVFANLLTPHSPYQQSIPNRFQPPFWMDGGSWEHPLGTDRLGRDILSRIILGTRITLTVAVVALALGGITGLVVGLFAGYFGGWVDILLMRATDTALAIPTIFLAILFAVTLGPSFTTVIVAVSLVIWSRFSRVIRSEVLRIREADFVALARVAGRPHRAILLHHILPNLLNTWVVLLSLELGAVVLIEAVLSFLGAGVPPPRPSWGSMVADGRDFISTRWWLAFFPGVAITLVVLAFNTFGDWLRDALDPKLRQT